MLTTRTFLSSWLGSNRLGAGIARQDLEQALRGAPDLGDLAAGIRGELLGGRARVAGRLGEQLGLDLVEAGEQVGRPAGIDQHDAAPDQLAGLLVELRDQRHLLGAHDHGLGEDEAVLARPLGPVGLRQQVGHLDPLRLDRLGLDALLAQEPRDRREPGIDLLLHLAELVAGRGGAQRPDREIGADEGLGQALDGDVAIGAAALLEAAPDQEARAEHAEREDQGAGEPRPAGAVPARGPPRQATS